jgi:hypothetical protein
MGLAVKREGLKQCVDGLELLEFGSFEVADAQRVKNTWPEKVGKMMADDEAVYLLAQVVASPDAGL